MSREGKILLFINQMKQKEKQHLLTSVEALKSHPIFDIEETS